MVQGSSATKGGTGQTPSTHMVQRNLMTWPRPISLCLLEASEQPQVGVKDVSAQKQHFPGSALRGRPSASPLPAPRLGVGLQEAPRPTWGWQGTGPPVNPGSAELREGGWASEASEKPAAEKGCWAILLTCSVTTHPRSRQRGRHCLSARAALKNKTDKNPCPCDQARANPGGGGWGKCGPASSTLPASPRRGGGALHVQSAKHSHLHIPDLHSPIQPHPLLVLGTGSALTVTQG